MKATTHTEVYRPFEGRLRRHPLRALTIAWSGVRVGARKRLPLLALYFVPVISCIVVSFLVHLKFMTVEDVSPDLSPAVAIGMTQLGQALGEVSEWIVRYTAITGGFALLAVAWYGAGLIAEDRRLGAHLLYFSRPISRFDYVLGKFLTTAFFGACAVLYPLLVVCTVACISSPNWIFLVEHWDVILRTIVFALMWITSVSGLVLAISSLVDRKGLALAGFFGLVFLAEAVSNVLATLLSDDGYRALSLLSNFGRVGDWFFGHNVNPDWSHHTALGVIVGLFVACVVVLAWRIRRLEAVA